MKILKKYQKNILKNQINSTYTNKNNLINSGGQFALKSLQSGYITTQQLESLRKVLVKKTNRSLKMWIKPTIHINKTAKAKESRMGKGKGKILLTVGYIKPGTILVEMNNNKKLNNDLFKIIKSKIPFKTKLVKIPRF